MENGRRTFIKNTFLTSIGLLALTRCRFDNSFGQSANSNNLILDLKEYLDLPEGFTYEIISKSGDKMNDGFYVPGRPDGMGTFEGKNTDEVIIVRNHENSPEPFSNSPYGIDNELLDTIDTSSLYDSGNMIMPGLGGTTTLIYNEITRKLEHQHLSLAGTYRNCAGGITPWKSWLSCEEDVTRIGNNIEKDHGFVFEISALEKGLSDPKPILGMGRFQHEAVAVDPISGIVYLTEDRHDGLFYRYVPNVKEKLHRGGKLQVLAVKNRKALDTRNWDEPLIKVNDILDVEWLDIDNVLSPDDDLRYRGFNSGAARFARGEGIWFGKKELYFAITNGGDAHLGQIFRYRLSPDEGRESQKSISGKLELFVESEDRNVLHMCDNLTITPNGNLLVCEDNGELNRILLINQNGSISVFACNRSSSSEFAGVVFSPSGNTIFVNIQENGDTLAITGPCHTL